MVVHFLRITKPQFNVIFILGFVSLLDILTIFILWTPAPPTGRLHRTSHKIRFQIMHVGVLV